MEWKFKKINKFFDEVRPLMGEIEHLEFVLERYKQIYGMENWPMSAFNHFADYEMKLRGLHWELVEKFSYERL